MLFIVVGLLQLVHYKHSVGDSVCNKRCELFHSVPFCEDVVDENVLMFENAVEDRPSEPHGGARLWKGD